MSTFRAKTEAEDRSLNRRRGLPLGDRDAGTTPQSPIQAGLGITLAVLVSPSTTSVVGLLRYATGGNEPTRVSFSQDPGNATRWSIEGAIGGSKLGFPTGLDYAQARGFSLEIQAFSRGGVTSRVYEFWVGSGRHGLPIDCGTREGFSFRTKQCCFNGRPLRDPQNDPIVPLGWFDHYFEPSNGSWAVGLLPSTSGGLSLECSLSDELDNIYFPDTITGLSTGKPGNPFQYVPESLVGPQSIADLLGGQQQLRPDVDAQARGMRDGHFVFADTVDGRTLAAGTEYKQLEAASYEQALRQWERDGSVASELQASWWDGSAFSSEASIAANPVLQLTLKNMQVGDHVYFFASPWPAPNVGPAPGSAPGARPGLIDFAVTQPLALPKTLVGSAVGYANGNSQLITNLGQPTSGSITVAPGGFAAAISGTAAWNRAAAGGYAFLNGQTGLTFAVPLDVAWLTNFLFITGTNSGMPLASATLYIVGVVCPNGGLATSSSAAGGTALTTQFGVDFPHGSYLTTLAALRFKS